MSRPWLSAFTSYTNQLTAFFFKIKYVPLLRLCFEPSVSIFTRFYFVKCKIETDNGNSGFLLNTNIDIL